MHVVILLVSSCLRIWVKPRPCGPLTGPYVLCILITVSFIFSSCSLEELGPESDNVVLAFKQLAEEFGEKFNKQFRRDI